MGTPTIEAKLRNRVLAVAVPALLAVGTASVAISSWVLDAADRDSARARTEAALHLVRTEWAEGDALEAAVAETVQSMDFKGVRVAVRGPGLEWRSGASPMLPAALSLAPGGCATLPEGSSQWVACAIRRDPFDAVVALNIDAHRGAIRTLAKATFVVVAVIVAALVWATRKAVGGPVESIGKLVRWSESIGDDAGAAPVGDTQEIQRLARSFDRLVRRLLEALARERASSAHMAHELRTPLTSILVELDRLAEAPHDRAIDRMREDVVRLERVIEAILVLSAPADPKAAPEVVNLADLAREAAGEHTQVDAPDEALVEGDARLISLALQNLLDNALKYSGHPARRIRVSRAGEQVRVSVIDDGPGLDDAARAKMFDRYWRGDGRHGGSGLGLALVRAVAERHAGVAEAVSNDPGPGLEVAMTFGRVVGWYDEAAVSSRDC